MLTRVILTVVLCACSAKNGEPPPDPHPSVPSQPASNDDSSKPLRERAVACAVDSDCVHLGDRCGWGCAVTVNKKYVAEVEKALAAKNERCNIDCSPVGPPVCTNGACKSPQRDPGKQAPTPMASAECKTASDCMVACFSGPNDCCGDACGCEHPYTTINGAALERARRANCPSSPKDCKEARCVIKHLKPDCANGHCVAVPDGTP